MVAALVGIALTRLDTRSTPLAAAVDHAATFPNGRSYAPSISAGGRFVAFVSEASNLVGADTNGVSDVFVRDRITGTTERVSVSSSGAQANAGSALPVISADGRFVAFESGASNLVAGRTDASDAASGSYACTDVFVRDRSTHTTSRISTAGAAGIAMSADGRVVALTDQADVFVYDRLTGTSERLRGASDDAGIALSGDGRIVAYDSSRKHPISGDRDVFVHDRVSGATQQVSIGPRRIQADGDCYAPTVSGDGRVVAFRCYSHGALEVFVRDRAAAVTKQVSVGRADAAVRAEEGSAAVSADGRFVAFESTFPTSDTVTCYRDGRIGKGSCIDVLVRDTRAGRTTLVSVGRGGRRANRDSGLAAISFDGRFVAFESRATNLVDGDNNEKRDVFLRDRAAGATTLISVSR